MKNLGKLTELVVKTTNYSLDYVIKIIGIFGVLWGIYILYQFYKHNMVMPLSFGDLILVCGAIILVTVLPSTLISIIIVRFIKCEKIKQMRHTRIRKIWWIPLALYDFLVLIYIICYSVNPTLPIDQNGTNILLIIATILTAPTIAIYVSSRDAKELLGHRILFLHDKGEKLRESYINFVITLGFDDDNIKTLSNNSWKLIEPNNWPKLDTINQIQFNIKNLPARFTDDAQATLIAYNELLTSVKDVANVSDTRIFNQNRDLVESASLEAYFFFSNLWIKLDPISRMSEPQNRIQLTLIENQLKESATRSGIILIDLCKFAVRIKPLLKR